MKCWIRAPQRAHSQGHLHRATVQLAGTRHQGGTNVLQEGWGTHTPRGSCAHSFVKLSQGSVQGLGLRPHPPCGLPSTLTPIRHHRLPQ